MSGAEQAADVIRALNGWPFMLLVGVLVFRRPITRWIDRMIELRVKYKEHELYVRLAEEAKTVVPLARTENQRVRELASQRRLQFPRER